MYVERCFNDLRLKIEVIDRVYGNFFWVEYVIKDLNNFDESGMLVRDCFNELLVDLYEFLLYLKDRDVKEMVEMLFFVYMY